MPPQAQRPTWILADPHGGANAAADRALLRLLDLAIERGVDMLVLGDLFRAFLAVEGCYGPIEHAVLDRFQRLRATGARVEFVVGNRDYGVREALLGRAFDAVHEDTVVLPLGGRPTLVAHGDRVNPEDYFYRAWFRLSRARLVLAAVKRLPPRTLRKLVSAAERELAATNTRYKTGTLPIPALEAFGRKAATRGAKRALLGHFHHDRTLEVPDGVPVVLAPGWIEHQRILRVGPEGDLISTTLEALEAQAR